MEKLSMCRICLSQDVRMHCIINTNLQEIYEKLTGHLLENKDARPTQVCYICYARLQNSYELSATCLQTEELFNQMTDFNLFNSMRLKYNSRLQQIHPPIVHLSIDSEIAEKCGDDTCNEQTAGTFDVTVQIKQEPEDIEEYATFTEPSIEFLVPNLTITEHKDILHTHVTVKVEHDSSETVGGYYDKNTYNSSTDQKNGNKSGPATKKLKLKQNVKSVKVEKEVGFKIMKNMTESQGLEHPQKFTGETSKYQKDFTPYKCLSCDKSFTHLRSLRKHMFSHTGEKPFKCDLCGRCFMKSSSLHTHKRVHTGIKPFKCDMCEKSFMQQSTLTKHILSHTGEKPHKCDLCEKGYFTKSNLDIHVRTHTGPYYCKWCNNWFNEKPSLYDHDCLQPRPYKCDICYKSFNRKDYLSSHALLHSGEQPFKCDLCGKYFRFNSSLTRHIRLHTGAKPYKCDICDKYYVEKCNLTKHMRKHADEKLLNEANDDQSQSFTNSIHTGGENLQNTES